MNREFKIGWLSPSSFHFKNAGETSRYLWRLGVGQSHHKRGRVRRESNTSRVLDDGGGGIQEVDIDVFRIVHPELWLRAPVLHFDSQANSNRTW